MRSYRFLAAAALLIGVCLFGGPVHAQVPQLINYQGRVAVSGTNFHGTGQFKFALVSGSIPTVSFWSNDGTSTAGSAPTNGVSLSVTKGLYSVLLGDVALTNMSAVPASVFSNSDVRLRIWFNDGTHGWQLLTPDQRIAAVGYAIMAGNAATVNDRAITSAKIADGAVTSNHLAPGSVAARLAADGMNYLTASGTASTISGTIFATQVSGLGEVAITGSYASLLGLPTIPSDTNQLTNGAGFVTQTELNSAKQYWVFEGDSLTAIDGPAGTSVAQVYLAKMPDLSAVTFVNTAHAGETAETLATQYTEQNHPYSPAVTGGKGVFFYWAGTNDSARPPAQIYEDMKTEWAAARVDGYTVGASTLTPRTGEPALSGTGYIAQTNALILSDSTLYDYLRRPDLLFPNPAVAANYSDGLHLTASAQAQLAVHTRKLLAGESTQSWPRFRATLGPSSGMVASGTNVVLNYYMVNEDTHSAYTWSGGAPYFTAPVAGRYRFTVRFMTTASVGGTETSELSLFKNGTEAERLQRISSGANYRSFIGVATVILDAGDIITIVLNQDSGSAVNPLANAGFSEFSGEFIPDAP